MIGVSPVVISQIEQGKYPNLNHTILRRISTALRFNHQQEMYVLGLLSPRPEIQKARSEVPSWIVESVNDRQNPVMVVNPAYDLMAWNSGVSTLLGDYSDAFFRTCNAAISVIRLPEMKTFFADWDEYARSIASGMRMSYGVHAEYRNYLSNLADDLAAENTVFADQWHKDDPLVTATIEKELNHTSLGTLRMIQIVNVIVEAPQLTQVEFLPADEATAAKYASVNS